MAILAMRRLAKPQRPACWPDGRFIRSGWRTAASKFAGSRAASKPALERSEGSPHSKAPAAHDGCEKGEKGDDARPHVCEKMKKQSWNVYDNKWLPFFDSPQSWNVYENKYFSPESWNVVDAQWDTWGRVIMF
jgi:hypothetical protein